jgi:anti-sigma-K factor RskA
MFAATDLPPLPAGKVYQIWVMPARGAPIPAGTFTIDTAGSATTVVQTPTNLPDPTAMAVSIEPEGGVNAPTGQ